MQMKSTELASAVIEYVKALTLDGCYRDSELPAEAIQAVSAESYLGEVNNGGHRQFVFNSGGNYRLNCLNALSGLRSMGAQEHAALLGAMVDWVEHNFDELVSSEEQFAPPPDFIRELDTKFYELEERSPMAAMSARWIRAWRGLKVVDDSQYEAEIQRLIASHPEHASRLITKRVHNLDQQMNERLVVSIGLAATQCDAPEMLLRVTAGSYSRTEEQSRMAWAAETTKGWRYAIVSDGGVELFEADRNVDRETEIDDEIADMTGEHSDRELPEFFGCYIGKRLSEVSAAEITQVTDAAHRLDASAALDLLLRRAGIDDQNVAASALYVQQSLDMPDSSRWVVYVNDRFFNLHAVENGARLAESEVPHSLLEVSRDEIRLHRNSLS